MHITTGKYIKPVLVRELESRPTDRLRRQAAPLTCEGRSAPEEARDQVTRGVQEPSEPATPPILHPVLATTHVRLPSKVLHLAQCYS